VDSSSFPVTRAEVYWYVFDKRSATAQEVALGTRMAKNTAQGHLAALEKIGILSSIGKPKLYRVQENFPEEYKIVLRELESLARSSWRLNGIEPV
jgi:DNA-binding IclR family transcriptional regulator